MRKLMMLLLVALLLASTLALAQEAPKKVVSVGSPEPRKDKTTDPKTGTPSTGQSPPTATEKIYVYAGTGTQIAASNAQLGDSDKPDGWSDEHWAKRKLIRVYNVDPDSAGPVLRGIQDYGGKPAAIFNGNIAFVNQETGEKRIIRGTDVFNYDKDGNVVGETDPERIKKAKELHEQGYEQFGSFANILGTFVQYYKQFSGLAGYSSLIFDEEFLADWRNTVNTIMCDKLHLPTQQCWVSKICAKYSDIKPTKNGILYTAPVGGAPRAIAHVEGQRSTPIVLPNQTSYLYTVTFGLTNPTDETMSYNVRFSGPGRAVTWWPQQQSIGKGGTAAALGAEALIKMSIHDYSQVCLEFNPSIIAFGGKKLGSICNSIVQQSPTASAPYPVANATAGTTPGASQPSAPGQPAPGELV